MEQCFTTHAQKGPVLSTRISQLRLTLIAFDQAPCSVIYYTCTFDLYIALHKWQCLFCVRYKHPATIQNISFYIMKIIISIFSNFTMTQITKLSCFLNLLRSVFLWSLQCSTSGGTAKQATGSVEEVDGRVAIGDQSGLEAQTLQQLNLQREKRNTSLYTWPKFQSA